MKFIDFGFSTTKELIEEDTKKVLKFYDNNGAFDEIGGLNIYDIPEPDYLFRTLEFLDFERFFRKLHMPEIRAKVYEKQKEIEEEGIFCQERSD